MSGMPPPLQMSGFALIEPSIVDFLLVCRQLPEDERRQYEAFQGQPFVADKAAVEFAGSIGPRWTLIDIASGAPIIIGGFTWIRDSVWQDWLLSTPTAWSDHWRTVSKVCRRVMDRMLATEAHRIQCIALASRTRAQDWYRVVGYELEGTLRRFGAGGEDAVIYARVN